MRGKGLLAVEGDVESFIIQFNKILMQYFEDIVRKKSTNHFVKDFCFDFEKTL